MLNLEVMEKVPRRAGPLARLFKFMRRPRSRSGGKRSACPPEPVCDSATAIRNAEPAIIAAIIEQAAQGSYLHAKFLFDYAGLSSAGSEAERELSLAEVLLERLGLEEEIPSLREQGGDPGALAEN